MYSQSDWFLPHFAIENQHITQKCVAFVVHFQTFLPKSVRNPLQISDTFTPSICTQHKNICSVFTLFLLRACPASTSFSYLTKRHKNTKIQPTQTHPQNVQKIQIPATPKSHRKPPPSEGAFFEQPTYCFTNKIS
jgi:hypothetical protein